MNYSLDLVKDFENKFQSPMYVFRKDDFIDNYNHFNKCFKDIYPNYQLSYSYKTNYTPAICQTVKELGGWAEVVSDMEYEVAKRIGYKNENIIYNGPYKGPLSFYHLLHGGILNIDNIEETKKVVDIAKAHPNFSFTVGIRVNLNIGQHFISRFGIDTENGDLDIAFNIIKQAPNVRVIGLHCHIGQSRTVEAWTNRVEAMLHLADKYFEGLPEYLDLGSGMFARMNPILAEQFGNDIPTFEEYAEAVATPIAEHYRNVPDDSKPILFTEPGTTLINSYIDFIGKVDSIKHIKAHEFVVMDCSKDNLGDICKMKQLPITIVKGGKESEELSDASFVGYTCLEHDVMYTGFSGSLAVGDYVIFENIGGYSNVSKPPFIAPNCSMIEVSRAHEPRVIKRRELFDDVFTTYIF